MSTSHLATRTSLRIEPDASRAITSLFVAGLEVVGGTTSRATGVVGRIMDLDESDVIGRVDELLARFGPRHRDIRRVFSEHAVRVASRLENFSDLSDARRLLLGAAFTHEYSIEAAAICNPSIVVHPDQSSAPEGGVRFVMSVRGIGEGHRSSIGFRTGAFHPGGIVTLDDPLPYPEVGSIYQTGFTKDVFLGRLRAAGLDGEGSDLVLNHLGDTFSITDLEARLAVLSEERDTRGDVDEIVAEFHSIAGWSYSVDFDDVTDLSERVLCPAIDAESHGVEDARFVLFTHDDGSTTYFASYTAFDGNGISQQLLQTDDFQTFTTLPVVGPAAQNKGLAIFPRKINGSYAALSRADGETNSIAFTDIISYWGDAERFQLPRHDWEVVQLGNCGSPIETDDGWLVMTHGVGPMRTYSIGAVLLDLDDPRKVVGNLIQPLLVPDSAEQDGYVPNVVYSCGAMMHDDTIILPYGISDSAISVATVSWPELRKAMETVG